MGWVHIFLAALQTLANIEPAIAANFHGGAAKTFDKVGSALNVVSSVSSMIAAGIAPAVDHTTVHPDLIAHAQAIASGA